MPQVLASCWAPRGGIVALSAVRAKGNNFEGRPVDLRASLSAAACTMVHIWPEFTFDDRISHWHLSLSTRNPFMITARTAAISFAGLALTFALGLSPQAPSQPPSAAKAGGETFQVDPVHSSNVFKDKH